MNAMIPRIDKTRRTLAGRRAKLFGALFVVVVVAHARAGLPEPNIIVYGQVLTNGIAATDADNVVVTVRIQGQSGDLATTRIGDDPNAGNHFVLRVPMENLVDGAQPRSGFVRAGDVVQLFVSRNGQTETLERTLTVDERGQTIYTDLGDRLFGDYTADGHRTLADYAAFAKCLDGEGDVLGRCAAAFDSDDSGGIDLADFAALARVLPDQ